MQIFNHYISIENFVLLLIVLCFLIFGIVAIFMSDCGCNEFGDNYEDPDDNWPDHF